MYVQYIWLIKSGKKRKVWNLNETIYTIYFSKSILSDDCAFNSDIKLSCMNKISNWNNIDIKNNWK